MKSADRALLLVPKKLRGPLREPLANWTNALAEAILKKSACWSELRSLRASPQNGPGRGPADHDAEKLQDFAEDLACIASCVCCLRARVLRGKGQPTPRAGASWLPRAPLFLATKALLDLLQHPINLATSSWLSQASCVRQTLAFLVLYVMQDL